MVNTCVAMNCSNSYKSPFSVHCWPKEQNFARLWTKFVQTKRADFKGPTSNSILCGAHFTEDQFENWHAHKTGYNKSLRLCSSAVPTIQKSAPTTKLTPSTTTGKKKVDTDGPQSDPEPPKKSRRAVSKMEVARLLRSYNVPTLPPHKSTCPDPQPSSVPSCDSSCQDLSIQFVCGEQKTNFRSKGVQVTVDVTTRDAGTKYNPPGANSTPGTPTCLKRRLSDASLMS